MPPAEAAAPALGEALALGLLQGPAELLPISSSGHTTLVPWMLGWRYTRLNAAARKDFEVALHAGAALGLALRPRAARRAGPGALALAVGVPALAGLLLQGRVERVGAPPQIAAGLVAGSLAMVASDRRHAGAGARERAGLGDGLALGLAQTLALAPGVSRNGATLAAARARGLSREAAHELSWEVGLPLIAGPALLRGRRLARSGAGAGLAGAAAAFGATFLLAPVLRSTRLSRAPLWPAALYRCALAGGVAVRMRRAQ